MEREVRIKMSGMYPGHKIDVLTDLKEAVHKGFVGTRKREWGEGTVEEFFISRRGQEVLEPPKKKKEE